jgi:hypothetical protein
MSWAEPVVGDGDHDQDGPVAPNMGQRNVTYATFAAWKVGVLLVEAASFRANGSHKQHPAWSRSRRYSRGGKVERH